MSKETFISAREAVKAVRSGDHVHLSSIASVPHILIEALCERAGELRDVHFHHFHTEGPAPYGSRELREAFFDQGFFVGANLRPSVREGVADYIPVNLFESQLMYRTRALRCDVALVQVSEPVDGMVSLGTSIDCSLAALEVARERIAVVNPSVPFAYGDLVPLSRFTALVRDCRPLNTKEYVEPSPTDLEIGRYCAQLIPDGACLQMGIGALPNAVCASLKDHRHLGLHTEMFSDGALELIQKGIIDNSCKAIDRGKTVASFLLGSQKVYDFIHRNPAVQMRDIAYTNDPRVIALNPHVVSINSAIEIDLNLFRNGRAAGLRAGRQALGRRQSHHRAGIAQPQGASQDCPAAQARGRRGHPQGRCPVGCNRIRCRQPIRKIPAGKGPPAHLHRPSGRPRSPGAGRKNAFFVIFWP